MRVRILASGSGDGRDLQYYITYLINDTVAIDAGCLGTHGRPAVDQARVRHVFLTHTHVDHVASLPIFLENVFEPGGPCPTVYASEDVLRTLHSDVFNERLWPDFFRLSSGNFCFLRTQQLEPGQAVEVDGLRITPIPVDHTVPTLGLIVEDGEVAVAIPSDTGPTEAFWHAAARQPRLRAVFLEASFPDALADLARTCKHLTPTGFAAELRKLPQPVVPVAVHMKPRYRDEVRRDLERLAIPRLVFGEPGALYDFQSA